MLRYTDYGALPPFANAANRALDKQVRAKEAHLVRVTADLDDQAQRASALLRHLQHMKQQLAHVQSLNDARGREIETEDHLKSVAEREVGRLAADMKRMAKELEGVQEQAGVAQNTIFRTGEKIAKLRAQLKQEEKELDDWLKVQQEKEEDNVILSKYAKEDEGKSRELALVIEKLVGEVGAKRAELNQALTETQVSQMEVERIAVEFRQLHQERQELLSQWEAAISTMRKRDVQIEQAQERYEGLKTEEVEKQEKINERQRQLDEKLETKAEIEKSIQTLDRHVAKLKYVCVFFLYYHVLILARCGEG
ncbi:hypothetical protein BCR44DRAFT_224475 [Catenaria anguillulae PL171]|uniref:Uncharacterized protein n=1 Tax=Catenaria anguillulae PL171 TaxID=765915 RepID=A0A1Y2H3Y0_9FUNG|nr:hypothetical protein BCR44DRAFT_224475 [Catenaria anguillulae PL171]